MAHTTTLKVRFYELDPYEHVNHTAYFGYFETARIEALESVGLGLHRLKEIGLHLVVVSLEARFVKPAVAGDVLTISSRMVESGRVTSRWEQEMTRDGAPIASLRIRAAVTGIDGRPKRLPPDLADRLDGLR